MKKINNTKKFNLTKIAAVTLSAALVFGCDDVTPNAGGTTPDPESGVDSGSTNTKANLYASISDTSTTVGGVTGTSGILIYTLADDGQEDLAAGVLSVDVLYPVEQDQDFSIGLYDDSADTKNMVADIILKSDGRIQTRIAGTGTTISGVTHTKGTVTNFTITWDALTKKYTAKMDGVEIFTGDFNNTIAIENGTATAAVASFRAKLASNDKIAAKSSTVDNIKIYSDTSMNQLVFEDDFEDFNVGDDLASGAGGAAGYYSGVEAVVAGVVADETTTEDESTDDFPVTLDEFNFTSGSYSNSGSATTALSGSGNDTNVITNTAGATSIDDTALRFNQDSTVFEADSTDAFAYLSYTSTENSGADQITGSFTLETVVKLSSRLIESDVALIDYADTNNNFGFKSYIESDDADEGVVKFKIYGEEQSTEAKTSATLIRGSWSHIIAVYDATAENAGTHGSLTIYINGVEQGTKNVDFLPTDNTSTDKFIVGGGASGSDKNLDGDLDNIATWNVALTKAQVIKRAEKFGL